MGYRIYVENTPGNRLCAFMIWSMPLCFISLLNTVLSKWRRKRKYRVHISSKPDGNIDKAKQNVTASDKNKAKNDDGDTDNRNESTEIEKKRTKWMKNQRREPKTL